MLQHCFCFMFWFFGHKTCGMLVPQLRIQPAPSALESKVLSTEPPGKSLSSLLWHYSDPQDAASVMTSQLANPPSAPILPNFTTVTLGTYHCFFVAQMVKNPPAKQETGVQSLSQEEPLEKGIATHSSILAWRIPLAIVHGVAKSWTRLSD